MVNLFLELLSCLVIGFVLYLFTSVLAAAAGQIVPFMLRLMQAHPKVFEVVYLAAGALGFIAFLTVN